MSPDHKNLNRKEANVSVHSTVEAVAQISNEQGEVMVLFRGTTTFGKHDDVEAQKVEWVRDPLGAEIKFEELDRTAQYRIYDALSIVCWMER